MLRREDCRYQSYYCEENVWWLSQASALGTKPRWVVFITSVSDGCAIARQRAAAGDDWVVWDYHVVLFVDQGSRMEVFDLDTQLDFPCEAHLWLSQSFPNGGLVTHPPSFRVLVYEEFLAHFSSDRRHMVNENQEWIAQAPPWPCITAPGRGVHTLDDFLDLGDNQIGTVLNLDALLSWINR